MITTYELTELEALLKRASKAAKDKRLSLSMRHRIDDAFLAVAELKERVK